MTTVTKRFTAITLTFLLSSCVYSPVIHHQQPYAKSCEMKTQKLKLSAAKQQKAFHCGQANHHDTFLGCLVLSGIIVPAGSFIISGSIVLVNNSLHWMEYQGKCHKNKESQPATETNQEPTTT